MKKFAVITPSETNPHPQGCFTNIKLPESCVLVDSMTVIFAPGAGVHVDFLVTLKGIQYIDGMVSRFTQNIEMADFAAFAESHKHYGYKMDGELVIQNDFLEFDIKTKIYKLDTVAEIMPEYVQPMGARDIRYALFSDCSQLNDVYGKLEYIINNMEPMEEEADETSMEQF